MNVFKYAPGDWQCNDKGLWWKSAKLKYRLQKAEDRRREGEAIGCEGIKVGE